MTGIMKIAILGYGVEGESVYNYYNAKYPDVEFTVYDNKLEPKNQLPAGVKFVGGVPDFKGIDADIAVKTPAIAPWKVGVTGEVTTLSREFLKNCPASVIGVTGTKGKGTTSSLIKSILDAAGKKTWLVGNIGVGALDVLDQIAPDDIVIYELSSFQLWDIDVSPHVAVVLGIEPEHLDVHKDFEDYVNAKSHIAAFQKPTDNVVYNFTNEYSTQIAEQSPAKSLPYLNDSGAAIIDGYFYMEGRKICPADIMSIPGEHNKENACAAIAAVWEWVQDATAIEQGLRGFQGLPYRIQKIRVFDDVEYYNDSYSSAPPATLVALESMHRPTILIAGGLNRGLDYAELGNAINESTHIKKVLLMGQTKEKIAGALAPDLYEYCDTLDYAVRRAHELATAGDAILLSPGCASFDMFRDFNERGRQFTELVEAL